MVQINEIDNAPLNETILRLSPQRLQTEEFRVVLESWVQFDTYSFHDAVLAIKIIAKNTIKLRQNFIAFLQNLSTEDTLRMASTSGVDS